MADDKFDLIIVGAGPAGLSAALTAARAGLNVVVLERGAYPGAKNVQGAVLYTKMLADLIPDFWKEPASPMERFITEQNIILTSDDASVRVGYHSEKWATPPHNCYTIIRTNFDKWFSQKAEEAGAQVITGITVSKVLKEGTKVVGIETSEGDQLKADCVLACDGVNSMLAQSVGLIDEWRADEMALGVKEILALPKERIQDRFALEGDEGSTYEFIGKITKGLMGYVFLYTNKESLAFGVGCKVAHFQRTGIKPYELLEMAKAHPAVRRLIADAKPVEYSAHMIPEGGYRSMPPLYSDGFLVAGDAAQMINPLHREGSNLAMVAGKLAAETVAEAKKKGDFSKATLSLYQQKLNESFVMSDLKSIKDLEPTIEKRMHFLTLYPDLVSDTLHEYFTVDGRRKKDMHKSIIKRVLRTRSIFGYIGDVVSLLKSI